MARQRPLYRRSGRSPGRSPASIATPLIGPWVVKQTLGLDPYRQTLTRRYQPPSMTNPFVANLLPGDPSQTNLRYRAGSRALLSWDPAWADGRRRQPLVGHESIACTHGLFTGKAVERLNSREDVTQIVTTNTVPLTADRAGSSRLPSTIATIPARTAGGRFAQPATTAAKSGSAGAAGGVGGAVGGVPGGRLPTEGLGGAGLARDGVCRVRPPAERHGPGAAHVDAREPLAEDMEAPSPSVTPPGRDRGVALDLEPARAIVLSGGWEERGMRASHAAGRGPGGGGPPGTPGDWFGCDRTGDCALIKLYPKTPGEKFPVAAVDLLLEHGSHSIPDWLAQESCQT